MAGADALELTTQTTEDRIPTSVDGVAISDTRDASPFSQSVLAALVYADLFDYPLTLDELVRYAAGMRLSRADVLAELKYSLALRAHVHCREGYYQLAGRSSLVQLRKARTERS